MTRRSANRLMAAVAALAFAIAGGAAPTAGQQREDWHGVLDQHPSIQYASRPAADRIARLNQSIAAGSRTLQRDGRTGYLRSLLDALGIAEQSQLLVFSKTGVQRAFTSPHTPRALYFDSSTVVGYIPGAPAIEIASHDPQQGVVFYTLDQSASAPAFTRTTMCLTCHVSASTLEVPGLITRSNAVGDDGMVMPQLGSNDVTHRTPHPDRWGGWFVTFETLVGYNQRAHAGNITFSGGGITSNQVFVDWMNSEPESRGYLSPFSDVVALLVFDHQAHAINLLTRLNWESRVAAAAGRAATTDATLRPLIDELAGYLLFAGESPPSVPLTPRDGFAERLAASVPRDRRGRSLAELDLVDRLFRYPCSYMIYSAAFDGLAPDVRAAVYQRISDTLSRGDAADPRDRAAAERRGAVLEILRDTKPEFPAARVTDVSRGR
ncbi:MAG TPA: hypothetical protein VKD69_23350 [Vicinamibacterales bacterium]|nr:hypothetical protein [Vicinamibacterales bacterium]